MRFSRPRSLSGLLLIGFVLVTIPLLVAVVSASWQMRTLSKQSRALVRHGVYITRHAQELTVATAEIERKATMMTLLGDPNLKAAFADRYRDFARSLSALQALAPDAATELRIAGLDRDGRLLAAAVEAVGPGPADMDALNGALGRFGSVKDAAASLGDYMREAINTESKALQAAADAAQRQLAWQAAALFPGTVLIVLVFVSLLARPIRQIDQAISELGRGTFSRPVLVHGPTDLERLGRQLEWLRVRLLDLAQEKNRFLRHISHELKTPLANIREGTELLMEGAVGPLDPAHREIITILHENGIKLQRLIENLLSFSAWQAKSVGLELSRFALRPLVRSVLEAQQLTLVARRVTLDVRVPDIEVTADRGKLRLILDNLLSNAVKFTPAGGAIHVHAATHQDQLAIDFADTGPGIPPADREHVFQAFYTGKVQHEGPVKGTGIGLSVVQEFVQAHGGSIELVDGIYPGAHFRIRLPLRPAAAGAAHAA